MEMHFYDSVKRRVSEAVEPAKATDAKGRIIITAEETGNAAEREASPAVHVPHVVHVVTRFVMFFIYFCAFWVLPFLWLNFSFLLIKISAYLKFQKKNVFMDFDVLIYMDIIIHKCANFLSYVPNRK